MTRSIVAPRNSAVSRRSLCARASTVHGVADLAELPEEVGVSAPREPVTDDCRQLRAQVVQRVDVLHEPPRVFLTAVAALKIVASRLNCFAASRASFTIRSRSSTV